MKATEKLYSFDEAYRIGRASVSIADVVQLEREIRELYDETPPRFQNYFEYELAFTAYTAGLLQGKREERQRRRSKAAGEVNA